jgi:hypothetical protein
MDTIITNFKTLATARIDWSPDGGMFWLTGMLIICGIMTVAAVVTDTNR